MTIFEIQKVLKSRGIENKAFDVAPLTEINNFAVKSNSNRSSLLFFNNIKSSLLFFNDIQKGSFKYGACFIKKDIKLFGINLIVVENPRLAMAIIMNYYLDKIIGTKKYYDFFKASILGNNFVQARTSIIRTNVEVGNDCYLGNYSILGELGMGSVWFKNKYIEFPSISKTILGNNVKIASNVVVCKGVLTPTVIRYGVRINSFSYIGHNSLIMKNTEIASGCHISGSVIIGENCRLCPGVIINDHVNIPSGSIISMGSVVTKSFKKENMVIGGNPAKILYRRGLFNESN